jgi:hypothetical protein
MATRQTSIRFTNATRQQLADLVRTGWGDTTKVVALAIDRMWRDELGSRRELILRDSEAELAELAAEVEAALLK